MICCTSAIPVLSGVLDSCGLLTPIFLFVPSTWHERAKAAGARRLPRRVYQALYDVPLAPYLGGASLVFSCVLSIFLTSGECPPGSRRGGACAARRPRVSLDVPGGSLLALHCEPCTAHLRARPQRGLPQGNLGVTRGVGPCVRLAASLTPPPPAAPCTLTAVYGVSYYNSHFEGIAAANAYLPKYQSKDFR